MLKTCFVCNSVITNAKKRHEYYICPECGHGHAITEKLCGIVVNERLEYSRAIYYDRLTHEQILLVKELSRQPISLLDVGSGTGKFLYHSSLIFKKVFGLEVDNNSLEFAKVQLGLNVSDKIESAIGPFDIITTWHALEHIPGLELLNLLDNLYYRSNQNTKYIVCVPNPQSLIAKVLGLKWAFRDVSSHLHEFSSESLNQIHCNAGFKLLGSRKMLSYNIFSWIQSLANLSPFPHNYIYYRMKRGWTFGMSKTRLLCCDLLSALWIIPSIMIGITGGFCEHIFAAEKSVHLLIYGINSATKIRNID